MISACDRECARAVNEGLQKWHRMQCIKEDSTLRVSSKDVKPCPRVVYREGEQDGQIQLFLRFRKLIKKIMRTEHLLC